MPSRKSLAIFGHGQFNDWQGGVYHLLKRDSASLKSDAIFEVAAVMKEFIRRSFHAFSRYPFIFWTSALGLAALFYKVLGIYQTIEPIYNWVNTKLISQFGDKWLDDVVYSPWSAIALIAGYATILWRTGGKITRRERSQSQLRLRELGSAQQLPIELIKAFFGREMLRIADSQKIGCEEAIKRFQESIVEFRQRLPVRDRPEYYRDPVTNCKIIAITECNKLKALLDAEVEYVPVQESCFIWSDIPDGEFRVHPGWRQIEEIRNESFFVSNEQALVAINEYYGALLAHEARSRQDMDRASNELRIKMLAMTN